MKECRQAELSALLDWNRGKLIAAALLSKAALNLLPCQNQKLVFLCSEEIPV